MSVLVVSVLLLCFAFVDGFCYVRAERKGKKLRPWHLSLPGGGILALLFASKG